MAALKVLVEEAGGRCTNWSDEPTIHSPDVIASKAGFGAFAASGAVIARTQLIEQPFNVAAFSHEFAHLWWGNYVVLEGTEGDFLLDEGLAQYGSMIAVDRVLGAAAGAQYRRQGAPGFNESLYSALGYLQINAAGMDRPLLDLGDDGLSYWIAYSKATGDYYVPDDVRVVHVDAHGTKLVEHRLHLSVGSGLCGRHRGSRRRSRDGAV